MLGKLLNTVTDTATSTLGIAGSLVKGELPEKKDLATLLATGLTVAEIAEATGIAQDVIEKVFR